MGVNSLPKTVTRQHHDCDLNPGPSAPESSTLTTRLPSHPSTVWAEAVKLIAYLFTRQSLFLYLYGRVYGADTGGGRHSFFLYLHGANTRRGLALTDCIWGLRLYRLQHSSWHLLLLIQQQPQPLCVMAVIHRAKWHHRIYGHDTFVILWV